MFDVGFAELLLIAVVALLVLGPERLPRAARTVGALVRRARESWSSVRTEVERELDAEELKRSFDDGVRGAREGAGKVRTQVEEQMRHLRDPLGKRSAHGDAPRRKPDNRRGNPGGPKDADDDARR